MAYRKSEKMIARKQARRRLFLDKAIALFGRLGYNATTVPMIVAKAQSSVGAFYLYFRNKEDVYAVALEEIATRISAAMNQSIARATAVDAQMSAAVEGFVQWLAGNPAEVRMLMEAATLGGRLEEARRAVIESHVRTVAAALEIAAPGTDSIERGILARCWVGAAIEAATGWLRTKPGERPEAAHLAAIVKKFNLQGSGINVKLI